MTTPAFDVVLAAVRDLEGRPFIVGAGSTTTVITDGSYNSLSQSDNQWRGGLLASKSLGGQANQITTVTASTPTNYTVSPAVAAVPTAGDLAYVLGPNFPPPVLLAKLVDVLLECATTTSVDTSLTTVAGQREYTIPTILTGRRDVVEVEIERLNTSPIVYDIDPGARVDLERGLVILDSDPYAGLKLRLRLRDTIPTNITLANLSSVTLAANLDPGWLGLELAARCAAWRVMQSGSADDRMTQLVNDLRARLDTARRQHRPVRRPYAPSLAFTGLR